MGDEFNIENVENLVTNVPLMEISDISKIIKEMIKIKNDVTRVINKKTKIYDIEDKTSLNNFTDNLKAKIKKCHIDSYDIVDDAINCIEELEPAIRRDLYDYYWEVYLDVLSEMEISINNTESIKNHSDKIYSNLLSRINDQIFTGKKSKIETNKKITYLNAITAYVFYECKFLIPIEGDAIML
ncbi:hypothetical protein H0486_16575 [Lachnospiraceae bacterium MD1]|uniref:Uncharacterized protein n=1 Tax=Variimorphobacter saccharofermentans TaxID=2755051 RepID=A0A839K3L1_9FIRM|nr:hypothetical protein [Variimorphobacter saccharofermentans]MBB2184495.1 hypothetical protein [Variimorphobacter saccharofermentans]